MRRPFTTPYNYRQRTTAAVGGGKGGRSSVAVNYYIAEEAHEDNTIRKGPWKSEEDEVLINHVNKYGPREWSSIRSKGLLRRTGKSCRLRWVNKLRPNLKNGCKFSAEEERSVIEMQAQIGNKWAKIATYLTGRTDNDVKNFWSSRQKRLARMRQASSTSSSSTPPPPRPSDPPQANNSTNHMISTLSNTEDDVLSLEVPPVVVPDLYSLAMDEEMVIGDGDSPFGFKPPSSSLFSAYINHQPECMRMVDMPALMNTNLLNGEKAIMDHMMTMTTSSGNPNGIRSEIDHLTPFPHNMPNHQPDQSQAVINEEELLVQTSFMDVFGESGIINDQLDMLCAVGECDDGFFCSTCEQEMIFGDQQQLTESEGGLISCNVEHGININGDDLKTPNLFFDDFPSGVFDDQMESLDCMESLPSPSEW